MFEPARKHLGDLGPLVANVLVALENDIVLLSGPRILTDVWVQMVVPPTVHQNAVRFSSGTVESVQSIPLAALLADTAWQVHGDQRPSFGAILLDQLDELVIFFARPRPLAVRIAFPAFFPTATSTAFVFVLLFCELVVAIAEWKPATARTRRAGRVAHITHLQKEEEGSWQPSSAFFPWTFPR
jgi:hypothetical protein